VLCYKTFQVRSELLNKLLQCGVLTCQQLTSGSVILINGAKAENFLWTLGTAATLRAGSVVEGSILAGTAIAFKSGSELRGCALAQTSVTFETAGLGVAVVTSPLVLYRRHGPRES
jgi:hypothetical protein